MTIWVIALIVFGVNGLVGYTLGAVRMAASLAGLLVACVVAAPIGHHLDGITKACGVSNPIYTWMLGPLIAFFLVWILVSLVGLALETKVDVYYKYKASDLQNGLWKRLNPRLGMCLGLVVGTISMLLVSWALYFTSYATTQLAIEGNSTWQVKLLNAAGESIQNTGMSRVVESFDSIPDSYYQCADIAGLIYHNDLLEGRLSRYPAFIALAQMQEFQDVAADKDFAELRQKQASIGEIMANPKAQAIVNSPDLLRKIYDALVPNLADLKNYLTTGQSEKYDSITILGRWDFDLPGTIRLIKQKKPNLSFQDAQKLRAVFKATMDKARFIAAPAPGKEVWLKSQGKLPANVKPKETPVIEYHDYTGTWDGEGSKFQLRFTDKSPDSLDAEVEGDRLTLTGDTYPMSFSREF